MQQAQPAIVLLAHGSRDPLWRAPIEAVAARITTQQAGSPVVCAYLELCSPTLAEAVQQLVARGAARITVVPMFLGMGKHAREDLPRLLDELRVAHPDVQFHAQPAVGEDARLVQLLAQIATEGSTE